MQAPFSTNRSTNRYPNLQPGTKLLQENHKKTTPLFSNRNSNDKENWRNENNVNLQQKRIEIGANNPAQNHPQQSLPLISDKNSEGNVNERNVEAFNYNPLYGCSLDMESIIARQPFANSFDQIISEKEKQVRAQSTNISAIGSPMQNTSPISKNNNDNLNAYFISPNNLHVLLGDRYDTNIKPDQNLIKAIRNNFFPTDRPIVLDNFLFSLPETMTEFMDVPVLPKNVTLRNNCKISSGSLGFYNGEIFAVGKTAVIYACGSDAKVHVHISGVRVMETVEGVTTQEYGNQAKVHTFNQIKNIINNLQQDIQNNNTTAMHTMGIMGTCGLFSSLCTFSSGIAHLHAASMRGNVHASHDLGLIYFYGRGMAMAPDLYRARTYFYRAHEKDHLESTFMIGQLYSSPSWSSKEFGLNEGSKSGATIGQEFYQKAADKGHLRALQEISEYNSRKFNFNAFGKTKI
jgi:hypothetical protein